MFHKISNPTAAMVTTVLQTIMGGQRWDGDFWDSDAVALMKKLNAIPDTNPLVESVKPLDVYIPDKGITYGVIVTGKVRKFAPKGNITCITSGHLYGPGILQREFNPMIRESDKRNRPNKHPQVGDLLLNRSGEGTLGRSTVFLLDPDKWVVSEHVNLVKVSGISPFTTSLYLNSWIGQKLIARYTKGVSGQTNINAEHVRSLLVPKFVDEVEVEFEQKFKKLHSEFWAIQQPKIPNSQKEMLEKPIFENYQRLVKELLDKLGLK